MNTGHHIILCERPVVRLQNIDQFVLGKPLSHPYLSFLDSNMQPIEEIHGTWGLRNNPRQSKVAKLEEFALTCSHLTGQSQSLLKIFNFATPNFAPVNRMLVIKNRFHFNRALHTQKLFLGDESDLPDIWQEFKITAAKIDKERYPYIRYAKGNNVNCQTTLREVLLASKSTTQECLPNLKLGDSGWTSSERLNLAY